MRPCIRLVLSACAILIIAAVSASAYDPTGGNAGVTQGSQSLLLAADQGSATQPHSGAAARRTKKFRDGLEQLGLSKKQMDEIGRITQEFRKAVEPLGPGAQALARERIKLVNQGAAKDKPRIAQIDQEIGKLRVQIMEARSKLQSRLMGILTPEQRQRFEQIIRGGGGARGPAAR